MLKNTLWVAWGPGNRRASESWPSSIQVCQDVNECQLTENGGCGELRECENLLGSHVCGPCPSGYIEDGPLDCQFTNPCAAGVHNCQKADYCDNYAVGEYHCYVS